MQNFYLSLEKSKPFIIFFLVLTLISCTEASQKNKPNKSTVGNVTFVAPKSWEIVEQPGGIAFFPPEKPLDQATSFIAILPGQDFAGNFKEWFDKTLGTLHKDSKVLSQSKVIETTDEDQKYQVLLTQVVLKTSDGRQLYRLYVGAHPGNRAELITFSASSQEEYNQYSPVLDEFLKTTDFVNIVGGSNSSSSSNSSNSSNSSPESKAKLGENRLSGLYVGTESRQQFNPNTKYYDYIVRQVYYFFSPDGRVYFGLPRGGTLENFSLDQAQKIDPNSCGIYEIQPQGQIQFRLGNNPPNPPKPFANKGKILQIGQTKFYLVESSNNLRLNGVYSIKTFTNTSSGNSTGSVSGETQITFSPDGKFAQTGFVGFSSSGSSAGVATSNKTSGSGTYSIIGNTLEFTYSDGQKAKHTFFIYPENLGEARPGAIVIDGGSYLLRN